MSTVIRLEFLFAVCAHGLISITAFYHELTCSEDVNEARHEPFLMNPRVQSLHSVSIGNSIVYPVGDTLLCPLSISLD